MIRSAALLLLIALAATGEAHASVPVMAARVAASPADASAEIGQAAGEAFAETWAWATGRTEITVVRLSGGADRTAPPLRVRFPGTDAPRGNTSVEVLTPDGAGGWTRAGWALVHVAWFETAAVVTRDLARGDAVTLDAFRTERIETTRLSDPTVAPDSLLTGDWTAVRTVRTGTPLTSRLLARPPAADVRDPVRILYRRGDIAIEYAGEARERGQIGDVIRVYSSDTHATHRVRLTAPGRGVWVATL